jgi:hypothetical protein
LWEGCGRSVRAEPRICLPPVQSDLLGLIDRADEKTYLDGEELNVGEIDLDVAYDNEALVEHAVQDVNQTIAARRGY